MSFQLYEFQQVCIDKLGKPQLPSRLIGDDMGLGKTVEALAIDLRLRLSTGKGYGQGHTTLIIAPLSVHTAWRRHIKTVCTGAKVYVIDRKNRTPFIQIARRHKADYMICHYEALRFIPELREVNFFHIIADEVHSIKSRKAQQTRAVKSLTTEFKTGLSGTPADNNPQDLWSIINWLYPKHFSSYWSFVKTYCEQELDRGKSGSTFRRVVGVKKEQLPALLAKMEPWYMRRLKEEVLPDLPKKTYAIREVELLPTQRKAYHQMKKEMIAWIGEHEDEPLVAPVVIAQLMRLQQFALASPVYTSEYVTDPHRGGHKDQRGLRKKVVLEEPSAKLNELCALIEENGQVPFVVFTQFASMVDLIARRLSKMGLRVGKYTGAIPTKERDWAVDAFQGGDLDIFAATIAAGGQSITLTRASNAVFLDRHWNPSKNVQGEDRLLRIGQQSNVTVTDIIAKNTVDLGRNQKIATKWSTLKLLFGDVVDTGQYIRLVGSEAPPTLQDMAVHDALAMFMKGSK